MPTNPPVASVSPSWIRRTASRAETTLPKTLAVFVVIAFFYITHIY